MSRRQIIRRQTSDESGSAARDFNIKMRPEAATDEAFLWRQPSSGRLSVPQEEADDGSPKAQYKNVAKRHL